MEYPGLGSRAGPPTMLTIPGPGITEGAQAGRQGGGEREGGHWTESVMKTDSSQLVTVVAAGHGLETCGAMRTQTRTETLDTSQQ